jgi:hypothetical protein
MRRSALALLATLPLGVVAACNGLVAPPEQVFAGSDAGTKCATPGPGCACIPAYWTMQSCYSGPPGTLDKGKCRAGRMTCSDDGILSACEGEVLPSAETCDGIDDDCNGVVDDLPELVDGGVLDASMPDGLPAAIASLPVQCFTRSPGLCMYGHNACGDGGLTCVANAGDFGVAETCNGIDDDCNGLVDDGISNAGPCVLTDPTLKGECKKGTLGCTNGTTSCMATYVPQLEQCNGLDDDCDGTADNNNPNICPPCYGCYGASGCQYICCPYVFAWDGHAFRYETTVGGASLVGRRAHLAEGRAIEFAPMWIRMDRAAIDYRGDVGRARAKIVAADDEIAYLDYARLTVVHHPAGTEVFSSTSAQWNTLGRPDPRALYALRTASLRTPVRASWMGDTDATAALSVSDERAAPHDERVANFYELDFGPVTRTRTARLVIDGWKIKKLRGLGADVARERPRLEVRGVDGRWKKALDVATPRGDRKAVVVDLAGVEFPTGRYEMRLWTGTHEDGLAMWYLDRVRLTEEAPVPLRTADLAPARADLGFSGAPSVRDAADNTHPLHAVDDGRGALPPEHRTWGRFTRYGDVSEIVSRSDDRLTVMRRGDAVELAFDGIRRPRDGEVVSLLLDVSLLFKPRVWLEDGESTDATRSSTPLPYHGMGHYPPPAGAREGDAAYADYLRAWQTREYLEGDTRWGA